MSDSILFKIGLFITPWLGGILSAWAMRGGSREWYDRLLKAPWNPPGWVFGPAWSILYMLIGWSSYEYYIAGGSKVGWAIYLTQLILNWSWAPLFFGVEWIHLAFANIMLLLASIVVTMIWFSQVSSLAAFLLVPYLLWVTFATSLNGYIVIYN